MTTTLDQTQDLNGQEIHRLTTLYGLPDFVKSASDEQLRGDKLSTPRHLYGDPLRQQFPCHSKAATFVSTMFLMDRYDSIELKLRDGIEDRLNKAASFFHIAKPVRELKEKMAADAAVDKGQLPDEAFALVTPGGDRRYPLRNGLEVKAAAAYLAKFRDEFLFDDRHKMASRILVKATEFGETVGEHHGMLEQMAGFGRCAAVDICDMLSKRAALARRLYVKQAEALDQVREAIEANPASTSSISTLLKIAGIVDQFDRSTHMNRRYADGDLQRPEELIFQVTEKVAKDIMDAHISTTTGNIYAKEALSHLKLSEVRAWMGDDFANAVSAGGLFVDLEKIATIAPTLPRGDAAVFDRFLTASGITPTAKQAGVGTSKMTHDHLHQLAASYSPS